MPTKLTCSAWLMKRQQLREQPRGERRRRYSSADCSSTVSGRVPGAPGGGRVAIPTREALMAPPSSRTQPGENRLLALLPPGERDRLFANLEQVSLKSKQVIARPGEAYANVLFPLAGVVS